MAEDWDPFADPSEAAQAAEVVARPTIAEDTSALPVQAASLDAPAVEDALLQPWELNDLQDGCSEKTAEQAKKGASSIPSLAQLERELVETPVSRSLYRCNELVEKSFAGDLPGVKALLEAHADPNTIMLREERMKGSDGCCSCTITSEEYTPLIAACMSLHFVVAELLLENLAIDVNIVCHGIDQEPYKQFAALDMAKLVRNEPLVDRLKGLGAKPASELPLPAWPRAELKTSAANGGPQQAGTAARLPLAEQGGGPQVAMATTELVEEMRRHRQDPLHERARLFKGLLLEWHPDKRQGSDSEAALATAVFQWLNSSGRCFLAVT